MAFRVGQKVVCVRAAGNHMLSEGQVYTVSGIATHRDGRPSVFLAEVVHDWTPHIPFYADRFRHIVEKKTDISIFTAMLDKTPERVG